jgi:hypothetical protein
MRRFLLVVLALAGSLTACKAKPAETGGPSDVVASIIVSPSTVTLDPGGTVKLAAEAHRGDGSIIGAATFTWTSSSTAVATVAGDGTVTAVAGGTTTITAASGGASRAVAVTVRDVYDLDARGVPTLVTSHYLDLAAIDRISLFRSGIGHDYSDSLERCRSMKHYFMPRAGIDWGTLTVSSPAEGTIVDVRPETTFGSQILIRPTALSAATIVIFHVVPDGGIAAGTRVSAGQRLGRHFGSQTMSDVAIRIETPGGGRLVSYVEAMNGATFAAYQGRGAASRGALVISRADRDANPLACNGDQFAGAGSLTNWFQLQ